MAHIFFIVEGQTEEKFYKSIFAKSFLPKHSFEVTVMPVKRNIYLRSGKGGSIKYEECRNNVRRFLRSATHSRLIILIYDYYGLDDSFKENLTAQENNLSQKIQSIQTRLENDINDRKFKFRLQIHEFEAYLFSQPEKIVEHYRDGKNLAKLFKILSEFNNNPELINDSRDTAPSKRIINLFPEYEYGKTTDGINIIDKIGVAKVREKCSYFNSLCNILEAI